MNYKYMHPDDREYRSVEELSSLPPSELQTYRTMRSIGSVRDEGEHYDRDDKWD